MHYESHNSLLQTTNWKKKKLKTDFDIQFDHSSVKPTITGDNSKLYF